MAYPILPVNGIELQIEGSGLSLTIPEHPDKQHIIICVVKIIAGILSKHHIIGCVVFQS